MAEQGYKQLISEEKHRLEGGYNEKLLQKRLEYKSKL